MFVRVKRINGKEYAYLVENYWVKGTSKQKVKRYLGPVVRIEKEQSLLFTKENLEQYIDTTQKAKIMEAIILHHLGNYGFIQGKKDTLTVNVRTGNVTRGKKSVVLASEEGFIYKETMKQLVRFKPKDEKVRGQQLAEAFSAIGIPVQKNLFVLLYRKIYNV